MASENTFKMDIGEAGEVRYLIGGSRALELCEKIDKKGSAIAYMKEVSIPFTQSADKPVYAIQRVVVE